MVFSFSTVYQHSQEDVNAYRKKIVPNDGVYLEKRYRGRSVRSESSKKSGKKKKKNEKKENLDWKF